MKKDKRNKNKDDGRAINDVEEVGTPAAEKSRSKKKLAIGMATGIGALAVGVGISLLVNGKLDFRAALHTSAVKGTEAISDGAAEAIAQAPNLLAEEPIAVDPKVVDIDWFIRKLPERWHASQDAISYANAIGVNLAEGQTIVRPQTRLLLSSGVALY